MTSYGLPRASELFGRDTCAAGKTRSVQRLGVGAALSASGLLSLPIPVAEMFLVGTRHRCMLHRNSYDKQSIPRDDDGALAPTSSGVGRGVCAPDHNWRGGRIYRLAD